MAVILSRFCCGPQVGAEGTVMWMGSHSWIHTAGNGRSLDYHCGFSNTDKRRKILHGIFGGGTIAQREKRE